MECRITSKWIDDDGVVEKKRYGDGSLALTFTSLSGEPLAKLTVNLSAYGMTPPDGCVFVPDYSESEGLPEALEKAGVAKQMFIYDDVTDKLCKHQVVVGPYGAAASVMKVMFDA